ncbi:YopX family protein [uncultured Streptococcus sp.]|uniref:YopX family protein n=1 Tax=uncultured Streptococcus sp. TaxID=83427 RepID=UPI0028D7285B|nr:YopX family protein [uncultured Streptococcus sp.]
MIPKFRAWIKSEKCFADYIESIRYYSSEIDLCWGGVCESDTFNLDDVELILSTGLKDKNGKEIFEGDIVQYQNSKVPSADSKGVIRYFDNWAMFGIDIEHNEPRALFFNGLADHISLDVVGNTYENPELIE